MFYSELNSNHCSFIYIQIKTSIISGEVGNQKFSEITITYKITSIIGGDEQISSFGMYIRVSQRIRNSEKHIAHTIKSCLLMPNGHYQNFITIEIDLVVSQDKSSFV